MTASHPPPGAASRPAPGTPCSNGSNDYGATSAPGISKTARTSFENARDFVPVMPYDVNILIFGQLDYSARVRCTGVCKTWRRFLLGGWKGLSQTIHLQPNDCMGYFSAKIAEWLSTHLTSSDVQHFTFIGVAAYMPELTRILHTANYSFLHTLRLEVSAVTYSIERQIFWDVIQTCSRCLEKLVLRGIIVPVDDDTWSMIFSLCTRLQYLSCYIPSTGTRPNSLRLESMPAELQLASLHWSSTARLPYAALLSRCRRLRQLFINTTDEAAAQVELLLEHAHTLCSELQVIKLQKNSYPSVNHSEKLNRPVRKGLHCAVLQGSNLTERAMATVVLRNQSTLLDVSLNHKPTALHAPLLWRHLGPLQGPVPLQAFEYDGFHHRDPQASSADLYQFLRKCAALRKLTMANILCNERDLCDGLSHCQKLTKVHLRLVDSDWSISRTNILDAYYAFMHCPYLDSLALDSCAVITDHFISRLSNLNRLTYVRLVKCNNISARGLEALFSKSMSQLRLVYIEQMVHLDDRACVAMSRLPRLARVCFVGCPNITDQGIDCLIEAGKSVIPCRRRAIIEIKRTCTPSHNVP